MKITSYRNAKRLADGWIECEIDHPDYGWIPFSCNPQDQGSKIDVVDLFDRMNNDPLTAPYVAPDQVQLDVMAGARVRMMRDELLRLEVDPIVMNPLRWAELTSAQQTAVAQHRRALLDISEQPGFPHEVVWPTLDLSA